jgi:hypothetical protein
MTGRERREAEAVERCKRKRRYGTWEDARVAGVAVWLENPRPQDANPPAPYACRVVGDPHYHIGLLRFANETADYVKAVKDDLPEPDDEKP